MVEPQKRSSLAWVIASGKEGCALSLSILPCWGTPSVQSGPLSAPFTYSVNETQVSSLRWFAFPLLGAHRPKGMSLLSMQIGFWGTQWLRIGGKSFSKEKKPCKCKNLKKLFQNLRKARRDSFREYLMLRHQFPGNCSLNCIFQGWSFYSVCCHS